jgi:hypothetical protein
VGRYRHFEVRRTFGRYLPEKIKRQRSNIRTAYEADQTPCYHSILIHSGRLRRRSGHTDPRTNP